MKPQPTEPAEGKYTFDKADVLRGVCATARSQGKRPHASSVHESCPDWFFLDGAAPAGRELTLARMREHITTEVGRYRGRVASWDVVNEALSDKAGEYLRPTKWLACIGDDYIAEAFIAARKADPSVDLYYNDYSIENPVKREKALRLVRELQAKHVPIDGIGIQGHWSLDKVPYQQIEDSLAAFRALGVKVMFTELDLDVVPRRVTGGDAGQREEGASDPYAAGCPPEILQRQAEQYGRIFAIFRKHHEDISRVTFWGLHDGRSWLNTWPRKRTNYPLLWSRDLTPKSRHSAR